jgi:hypothetical protein
MAFEILRRAREWLLRGVARTVLAVAPASSRWISTGGPGCPHQCAATPETASAARSKAWVHFERRPPLPGLALPGPGLPTGRDAMATSVLPHRRRRLGQEHRVYCLGRSVQGRPTMFEHPTYNRCPKQDCSPRLPAAIVGGLAVVWEVPQHLIGAIGVHPKHRAAVAVVTAALGAGAAVEGRAVERAGRRLPKSTALPPTLYLGRCDKARAAAAE